MKPSFKLKVRKYWEDHKELIISAAVIIGGGLLVIFAGSKLANQDPNEDHGDDRDETIEEPAVKVIVEYPKDEAPVVERPSHEHFECGAEIVQDELGTGEFPEIMVNDIPLDNMEAFAEEMKRRIKEAGLEEAGWVKDANKAKLSAWITVQGDAEEEETTDGSTAA